MPKISIEVPHSLGRDEAARRLKKQLDVALRGDQGMVSDVKVEWIENALSFAFKAMGMKVAGTMAIEDSLVRAHADSAACPPSCSKA